MNNIKLMKGKALRKHSLHEKTAASVLLKLFTLRRTAIILCIDNFLLSVVYYLS